MNRTAKLTLCLAGGLLLLLLLATTISPFTLSTSKRLTLTNWLQLDTVQAVVLWPEPEETPLVFGPTYLTSVHYVELVYGNAETDFVHTLFQSDSFDPFFAPDGLLKRYNVDRDDVSTRSTTLLLDGEEVGAGIRRSSHEPRAGVTLFRLGSTCVVHHWQGVDEAEALALLERGVQLVEPDDTELIEAFDQRLQERAAEATARRTAEAASQ